MGWGKLDDQQRRDFLMQVGHALNLVCELPEWLEHAVLAKHLRHAAAESFAMNCRVLAEFLWSSATQRADIRAADYCGEGWRPDELPARLRWMGDKHVAHMSDARADDPLIALSYDERAVLRGQLVAAAEQFTQAIQDRASAELMTGFVAHARTLAAWPPPATDEEDPGPFIDAIAHLG